MKGFPTHLLNTLNPYVLETMSEYFLGGGYDWDPKDFSHDGSTRDILYGGEKILRWNPKGTYCCGLTMEIYLRACALYAERRGAKEFRLGNGQGFFGPHGARVMKREWFCPRPFHGGMAEALIPNALGQSINYEHAQPGDFVQLWRENGTGHSCIFLSHVEGGFRYWSTQLSTNGIGERVEYFAEKGKVKKEDTYFVRAFLPELIV